MPAQVLILWFKVRQECFGGFGMFSTKYLSIGFYNGNNLATHLTRVLYLNKDLLKK